MNDAEAFAAAKAETERSVAEVQLLRWAAVQPEPEPLAEFGRTRYERSKRILDELESATDGDSGNGNSARADAGIDPGAVA